MTECARALTTEHPVAAHLRQSGIVKAFIIDDAYDAPTRDAHRDEIPVFWDKVFRQPELLEELRGMKPNITDESEIDDDLLIRLWEQRESLTKLGPVLKEDLFAAKLEDVSTLNRLGEGLSQLGVEPVAVGSEQTLPAEPVKLVFIDYYLGPAGGSDSVNAATSRAREIYRSTSDAFIVLMSSKPDAEAAKDTFRKASGLLGGLFGYCPKEDLSDKERLYLHLATWALDMPTRHQIQHFVEALESAVESAKLDFVERIRALGFEDYANIQWLSLQAEGHPLGEYMLWLYKSLLAHLLHDNPGVLAQQKKLDAMAFEQFTPSQGAPSPELAEIYFYALTEPCVEELGPHPRASESSLEPLLRLGDLFVKDQTHDVLMVINAACDLAYAPGTKRAFPESRSILLMHGHLHRYEEIDRSDAFRTELFKYDGKVFRILWDHRRVTSKDYGQVRDWLGQEGYVREARLALPYALQVQQVFGMHLMRIGVPTKPPMFRHADVEIYCEGDDGNYIQVDEPIRNGALIIRRPTEDQDEDLFVLMLDCIGKIVSRLAVVVQRCESQKARLADEISSVVGSDAKAKKNAQVARGRLTGVEGKLAKLEQLKSLSQVWVRIARTLSPLPGFKEKKEVDPKLLWVYRDRAFAEKYSEGPPIVLNIRSEQASSEEQRQQSQSPATVSEEASQ